jgi:transketolase
MKPASLTNTALLARIAAAVQADIMTGHDHPNTQDELTRLQAGDLLRQSAAEIEALRKANADLREWAKLAFRAMNNITPELLGYEAESTDESDLTARLCELVDAACWQYPVIAGVNEFAAIKDAREALGVEA